VSVTRSIRAVATSIVVAALVAGCGSSSYLDTGSLESSIAHQVDVQGSGPVNSVNCQSVSDDTTTCQVTLGDGGGLETVISGVTVVIATNGDSYTATFPDGSTVSATS
jgi:hypothetical protein